MVTDQLTGLLAVAAIEIVPPSAGLYVDGVTVRALTTGGVGSRCVTPATPAGAAPVTSSVRSVGSATIER